MHELHKSLVFFARKFAKGRGMRPSRDDVKLLNRTW